MISLVSVVVLTIDLRVVNIPNLRNLYHVWNAIVIFLLMLLFLMVLFVMLLMLVPIVQLNLFAILWWLVFSWLLGGSCWGGYGSGSWLCRGGLWLEWVGQGAGLDGKTAGLLRLWLLDWLLLGGGLSGGFSCLLLLLLLILGIFLSDLFGHVVNLFLDIFLGLLAIQ